jgi:hypothetical protein
MQSWAKRGFQTALVTGGLLMLGTGIASADENVNPDTPASPVDLSLTIPVDIAENAIGTPIGQFNLPGCHEELSTKPVTDVLRGGAKSLNSPAAAADKQSARHTPEVAGSSLTTTSDALKGNKASGDVVVPIQITGNAIGIIGDAVVDGSNQTQTYSHHQDVATDGTNSGLAGNAVVLDWALPIQISGNAVGLVGGSGMTSGSASQSATETGNIATNGSGSGLSGNVVAGQFATPVQVTGNAASWILGNAYSEFDADSSATSGGYIETAGDGGAGTGNVVGVPLALPVKLNGNAAGLWGSDADAVSNSSADAKAGDTTPGWRDVLSYIQTNGHQSFLAGNIIAPQGGLVANIAGVAGSWIGNSTTGNALGEGMAGTSSSTAETGGFVSTDGQQSAVSGNVLNPALALPVEAFGIGASYIGNSHASHDNTTHVSSGDGSHTNGIGSLLSGNIANTQSAATAEVFGIGASHVGNASGAATEEKVVTAGNYDGTLGDDSLGSGNLVRLPVALPAEMFGIGGSLVGQGYGLADETKIVTGGGDESGGGGGNTDDDNGVISSNLATVPASVPVQLFGVGGAVLGQGHGKATTDTTSSSGGDVHASGPVGTIAGNLIQAPISLPVQGHGVGGALLGIGSGESDNLTYSEAGGNASTDGHDGALTGNILQTPIAGAATLFGDGAGLGGLGHGTGNNDVLSTAGGDSATNGDGGAIAGNVLGVPAIPIAQVFGDAVSAAGIAGGDAVNTTTSQTGGNVTTSGADGAISGSVLDVPAVAVAQVFGVPVAVAGLADAVGDNQTTGKVGGVITADGDEANLSGLKARYPVGALVQIYDVALELFGTATGTVTDATALHPEPQINIPFDGSELPADQLPTLSGVGGGLPSVDSLPSLSSLPLTADALPTLPGADHSERADLPQVGTLPVQLPTALPALPVASTLPVQLPTAPALPALNGVKAPQVQVPALAQMDSLSIFSKVLGPLTGKPFHTM